MSKIHLSPEEEFEKMTKFERFQRYLMMSLITGLGYGILIGGVLWFPVGLIYGPIIGGALGFVLAFIFAYLGDFGFWARRK